MATFAGLFGGRNPLENLQAHMPVVHDCARHVVPLIQAVCDGDHDSVKRVAKEIFELEEKADRLKHDARAHLPKSLFMPVDRRDVLELLHLQDSIADTAQDIAGLFLERRFEVPDHMRDPLERMADRCVHVVGLAAELVGRLNEVAEMGFRGPRIAQIEGMINRLNAAEDGTDDLGAALSSSLFAHEDEMKPVSVLLWYQQIQWIGDLADYAEKVANRIRLVIAR